ncbi:hypothetical protein TNCV_1456311 [Trichonephila clavipes]|nr:hypothetical protein TNCV_1456311 [Trichonephila clavipes]
MLWRTFSWVTLEPLVLVEEAVEVVDYLSIIANQLQSYMASVFPTGIGIFQSWWAATAVLPQAGKQRTTPACSPSRPPGCRASGFTAPLMPPLTRSIPHCSLVVRALDSKPESMRSMPDATKYPSVHTEYVLVKSVGSKVLWAKSRVQGTGEYFSHLQFHAKIVELEIGGVAIYRPFGNFAELIRTVTCKVAKANDRRISGPLSR